MGDRVGRKMKNYISTQKSRKYLELVYKEESFEKLVEFCKKYLEKNKLDKRFTAKDIIQEASLKILTKERK